MEIWENVLQGSAPTVAASGTGFDYLATSAGTTCTYTYQLDGRTSSQRTITYDNDTGVVVSNAN
ncbi:hypothetical protein D3C85_1652750 [compost metagenome]